MITVTFVLLLVVSGENLEFTPHANLSDCLSTRRKIQRNVGRYQRDFDQRWVCKEMTVRLDELDNEVILELIQ